MSGNSWFAVENSLVDRTDLTLIEKMCCVVLARYAGRQEFSHMLNTHVVAIRMGCSIQEAESAIQSLMNKGLILLENFDQIEPDRIFPDAKPPEVPKNVVKAADIPKLEAKKDNHSWLTLELGDDEEADEQTHALKSEKEFESDQEVFEETLEAQNEEGFNSNLKKNHNEVPLTSTSESVRESTQKSSKGNDAKRPTLPSSMKVEMDQLVEQVYEIIDENINDREARIILSFANNNIELIREKYKVAKKAQVKDKIEVLINELQKKEPPIKRARPAAESEETASTNSKGMDVAEEPRANQQINLSQINSMAAFKQSAYGKKTQK